MQRANVTKSYYSDTKSNILMAGTVIVCAVLFVFFAVFDNQIQSFIDIAPYVTWHNLFEMASILVSFSVFVVTYYTYNQTKWLRPLLLGVVFLCVGIIDLFHTLSYKGMPAFFNYEGCCANRATTFWVIARVISAIGILATAMIPKNYKSNINRVFILLPALFLSIAAFVVVTYYPDFIPAMFIEGVGLTLEKIILEYVIVFLLVISALVYYYEYRKTKDSLIILFICALIVSIYSELAFTMYYSINDVYNFVGHIFKVISYFIIFRVKFIYNVQNPYIQLHKAQNTLELNAYNLDKIVEHRTRQLKKLNERLMEDLDYARDIQKALLPQTLPKGEGLVFYSGYYPAQRVSGDFYDILELDEENIAICIGDVSGHGVAGAMLTVFLKQSIESVKKASNGVDNHSPSQVLEYLYSTYNNSNFKEDVYIVVFYAIYNKTRRELTYSSAGFNAEPLLISKTGVNSIEIKGLPICKLKNVSDASYQDNIIRPLSGNKIFLYTDGLVEARDKKNNMFTEKRLKEIISEDLNLTAEKLQKKIDQSISNFVEDNELIDDITYVIIEIL